MAQKQYAPDVETLIRHSESLMRAEVARRNGITNEEAERMLADWRKTIEKPGQGHAGRLFRARP
jgi:hypothetical protein